MKVHGSENKSLINFKRFLFFGGLFNILVTFLLVLPWTLNWYVKIINDINSNLNLGGAAIPLSFDPFSAVLINCAGNCIVLIGAIIIYCSFDPIKHKIVPLLNALARILFFFIVLYYIIYDNLARVMLGFGIADLLFGTIFLFYLIKLSKTK